MLIYLLKVNIVFILLYGCYRLMCYKDTFFGWRRTTLLLIYAVSLVVPALNIEYWTREQAVLRSAAEVYAVRMLPEVGTTTAHQTIDWLSIFVTGYLFVAGLLLMRFAWQLVSIVRLAHRCDKKMVQGVPIRVLPEGQGPFSFFRWIFLCPTQATDQQLHEILLHEQTHCRQHHSADVLISQLFVIAFWANPFIWLMRREIRINLEYLADNQVLKQGADSRTYQYHLLGLTYTKCVATLSNNFNVLPLKKRIQMMNKRRTKGIRRVKYALFVPLAAALLVVSNIETVARAQKVNKTTAVEKENYAENDSVFDVCEHLPDFPGGDKGLMTYLQQNVKYPKSAEKNKQEGHVIVRFVVEKDGSLTDFAVARSVSPALDAEALRVAKMMPKWIPAKNKGKTVRMRYNIPIKFSLR